MERLAGYGAELSIQKIIGTSQSLIALSAVAPAAFIYWSLSMFYSFYMQLPRLIISESFVSVVIIRYALMLLLNIISFQFGDGVRPDRLQFLPPGLCPLF